MASYNITLSNGSTLAALYDLEANGPDNRSTPRQILLTRPSWTIIQTGALAPNGVVKVSGDKTAYFPVGATVVIEGSTGNDGTYIVNTSSYDGGQDETSVEFTTPIASAVADGSILLEAFVLGSDLTYRFVAGFTFDVQLSAGSPGANDGTWTVSAFNSWTAGDTTVIPVTSSITSTALPLGQIQYTQNDSRSSLLLPGRGMLNYGEMIIEDMVHMVEHFAADTAPESNTSIGNNPAAQPLTGQMWYKTLAGEEGFKYYDGATWTSSFDFDDGAIIFRDAEDGNKDIYITASESTLPAPWAGGSPNNEPGLVIWNQSDPPDDEPVFRVLSSGGDELLRVEYNSAANAGYVRTVNNIEVIATGNSWFHGNLGVGMEPTVGFEVGVDNSILTITTDLVMTAGQYVGIQQATPSEKVHIGDATRIDGRVGINQAVPVTNVPVGTDIWLAVTGDIQANSQFLGSSGSVSEPTYSFTDSTQTGLFLESGSPSTGLSIGVNGTPIITFGSDGALTLHTANYETLVAGDDVIPNKAYVDATILSYIAASDLEDLANVAGGSPATAPQNRDVLTFNGNSGMWEPETPQPNYVQYLTANGPGPYNTPLNVAGSNNTSGGKAHLQVFMDGVYLIEGVNYQVDTQGAGTITIIDPPYTLVPALPIGSPPGSPIQYGSPTIGSPPMVISYTNFTLIIYEF